MTRAQIGQQRRSNTRARLIAASARVIGRLEAASVARSTFYDHFAGREDLMRAPWATWGHDPFAEILRAAAVFSDPAGHLCAVTRLVLRQGGADHT